MAIITFKYLPLLSLERQLNNRAVNVTSVETSSDGVWQGDNPLDYAFPLLITQTTLIIILSRFLAFLLKPLRQPKVIAEILGGILLGPSAFGRNAKYLDRIFPKWSTPILESVASIGLLFFLFLVGIELDLKSVRRSGKQACIIALAGISLPFLGGVGVAYVLRRSIEGADKVGYGQYLVFMGVALSITAFPVLARILAELKLLTTQVGETAMAAAAFNDVAAWILLALAVALAGDSGGSNGSHKSPLISAWVLLSGVAFVAFMMIVIRPGMKWVARKCSPEQDSMDEAYIVLTLASVMVSGFVTDLIGIHSIFGAFVFGLTIPKGGDFADKLTKRIEDFVSGLLLPLYFASSGLRTDVTKMQGGRAWGLLALVITTACAGKILGTFGLALMCRIPAREALALGLLMNTKGLVELIVLNIGKEKKVLNEEIFAILVLMALFNTFITTPAVMAVYKPAQCTNPTSRHRKLRDLSLAEDSTEEELRILACAHGPSNIPSLINLIDLTRSNKPKSQLKLYIMHLVELTERTSSIMMVQRFRKNGLPCISSRKFRHNEVHDRVAAAFQAYGQVNQVFVEPSTAISALATMHEDICHVAEDKRSTMIILPFHKQWRPSDDEYEYTVQNMGHGWRMVNRRVLQKAPCSVGILVDRGFGYQSQQIPGLTIQRICIVFIGGPDDREALVLGGRMAGHPDAKVTVVRFVCKDRLLSSNVMLNPCAEKSAEDSCTAATANMNPQSETELDEASLAEFLSKWTGVADYIEKVPTSIVEEVIALGISRHYDLIVVGKGRFPSTMVAELAAMQAEHAELGPIGDILTTSAYSISSYVIQQHDYDLTEESPVSNALNTNSEGNQATITNDSSSNV